MAEEICESPVSQLFDCPSFDNDDHSFCTLGDGSLCSVDEDSGTEGVGEVNDFYNNGNSSLDRSMDDTVDTHEGSFEGGDSKLPSALAPKVGKHSKKSKPHPKEHIHLLRQSHDIKRSHTSTAKLPTTTKETSCVVGNLAGGRRGVRAGDKDLLTMANHDSSQRRGKVSTLRLLESPNERLVETLHQRESLFTQLLQSLDQVTYHGHLCLHLNVSHQLHVPISILSLGQE
jgi:hypothetical protein